MFSTWIRWLSSCVCNSLTRLHNASKSPISRICEPMWKCNPTKRTFCILAACSITLSMSRMAIPNLFSASPVVMLACVWAPTLGLIRSAIRATFPFWAASSFITSSSGMLSTLNEKMSLSSPKFISQSLFPTPAYTIFSAGKPAFSAASISPPLTQSAPRPASRIIRRILGLAFALTA